MKPGPSVVRTDEWEGVAGEVDSLKLNSLPYTIFSINLWLKVDLVANLLMGVHHILPDTMYGPVGPVWKLVFLISSVLLKQ